MDSKDDAIRELNAEFAKNQRERDTCGFKDCHAPKAHEIPTEAGVPIAVCIYHRLTSFPESMREEQAQELYDRSFKEIKEQWEEYNEKIRGENL